jgi:hypothetical protein
MNPIFTPCKKRASPAKANRTPFSKFRSIFRGILKTSRKIRNKTSTGLSAVKTSIKT